MSSALILLLLACAFAVYMAWTIGANDVANAMGPAVGSGMLPLRHALWIAGIAEFAGAVLVGSHVTDTIRGGIVEPSVFQEDPQQFMLGMTAALLGAALWLHAATLLGMPVSTTHSIVGAVIGFGLIAQGGRGLNLLTLLRIVLSWFVSPVAGGILGFAIYSFVRVRILSARDRDAATVRYAPAILFVTAVVLLQSFVFKGMRNLRLPVNFWSVLLLGVLIGGAVFWAARRWFASREGGPRNLTNRFFTFLLVVTSGYVAFAHGANDVANAVGPLAAVLDVFRSGAISPSRVPVPWWVLMIGGAGIVAGLAISGWRVIATIGGRITAITPMNGFAAQFGAATTVLVCSQLGLPISTTHTIVGAVIGVGMARGVRALNLRVTRNIISSWLLTLPFAAGATMLIFRLLESIFE